jgi:DNA replication protein DnaC
VTSNVPPSALGRALGSEHGQAIASRLAESCRVVALEGRDRRLDWARPEAA